MLFGLKLDAAGERDKRRGERLLRDEQAPHRRDAVVVRITGEDLMSCGVSGNGRTASKVAGAAVVAMETSTLPGRLLIVMHAVCCVHRMVRVFISMCCRCTMHRMPAKGHRRGGETLQWQP